MMGDDGGGTRDDGGSLWQWVSLPPELEARFEFVENLVSGGQADVLLVREVGSGRELVLKLYRPGVEPDGKAIGLLADAVREHVVEVFEWNRVAGRWFEVQEFCAHGSLRTVIKNSDLVIGLKDVVREVSTALTYVHGLRVVHLDLKPDNVLVREVSPLDLVLGDFGLVRVLVGSMRWSGRQWGTPAYAPPEFESRAVSPAWDWWSLGMIVAEIAGGRHPFESSDDGMMMNEQQLRDWVSQRDIDLSAVSDPRVVLLCRGLLTRDRRHRWGANEVEDWLKGRSPKVVADAVVASGTRVRQVRFDKKEYSSPVELAAEFQQHWDKAFRRLFQERDSSLVEEVEQLLLQHHLGEAVRFLVSAASAAELPRRFAYLLAEMDPALDPVYNSVRLTPKGIEAAALEVIRAGGDHPTAKILDEVRCQSILATWRNLPGMDKAADIQELWVSATQQLETAIESLEPYGFTPTATDLALGQAWLLLCALNTNHHTKQLATLVDNLDSIHADKQTWWHTLHHNHNPSPTDLTLTLLTQPTATQQTHHQQQQQREENERNKHLLESRLWSSDLRVLKWVVGLCATFIVPVVIGVFLVQSSSLGNINETNFETLDTTGQEGVLILYSWITGSSVIAIASAALLILRFKWTSRPRGMIIAAVLLAIGSYGLLTRDSIADRVLGDSRDALRTTPAEARTTVRIDSPETVNAIITVGSRPSGVVVDPAGTFAYVTNYSSGTVSKINLATNTVEATITVGGGPQGVAVDPAGTFAYITNYNSGTMSRIDLATNAVDATVTVGDTPTRVAVDPAGTFAYITNYNSGTVSKINLATNTVEDTITVGDASHSVVVDPAGTFAYVTNDNSGTVSKINLATNTVEDTITVGDTPTDVVVDPAGKFAYVTNYNSGTVSKINLATNTVEDTITVGDGPYGLAVDPAGTFAYVVNVASGAVSRISLAPPSGL